MTDLAVGSELASQFKILRRLGAGGMGAVFVAEQLGMDRQVVVKVMHAELTSGQKAVERFKREAKAVAALNHPNIVMVYTFGQTDDGSLFQAMELIDGRDLMHEIRRSPIEETRALKIIDQALDALIEAHSRGIVHRDLKPENIMLTARYGNPDHVKVLDFGIAKMMEQDADQPALTKEGAVFGTPRYMAPEQVRGQPVDVRTDLYPMGLVLYEMLTGEHPFGTRPPLEYMIAHASEPIAPPSGIAPATAAVLEKALAKEPEDRFQSAREMRDAVREAVAVREGKPLTLAPRPAPGRVATPARAPAPAPKRALWPWLVLVLVLAGAGIGVALAVGSKPKPTPTPQPTEVATVEPTTEPPTEDPTEEPTEDPTHEATHEPPPDPIPTTDLVAADDVEGFPNPVGVHVTATDSARVTLASELSAKQLLGFYKAKLAERGWKWEKFPNGIKVLDAASPFSTLYLSANAGDVLIYLTRSSGDGATP